MVNSVFNEFPALIDIIVVLSKGTGIELNSIVEKIPKKQDRKNMALKIPKGDFTSGIKFLVRKTAPVDYLQSPRTLSQLKSFIGLIHIHYNYSTALADTSAQLRRLLSKKRKNLFGRPNAN